MVQEWLNPVVYVLEDIKREIVRLRVCVSDLARALDQR